MCCYWYGKLLNYKKRQSAAKNRTTKGVKVKTEMKMPSKSASLIHVTTNHCSPFSKQFLAWLSPVFVSVTLN